MLIVIVTKSFTNFVVHCEVSYIAHDAHRSYMQNYSM